MKLSRIKSTLVTMVFLATVLLLTFSTNTYPLPAKKPRVITVQNSFYTSQPIIYQNGLPHVMLNDIFFTVCTLTPELRRLATSKHIGPAQWTTMTVDFSDDEYFSIGIHYTLEGGTGKRTMVLWVHHVHPSAKIFVRHDKRRVSASVQYK